MFRVIRCFCFFFFNFLISFYVYLVSLCLCVSCIFSLRFYFPHFFLWVLRRLCNKIKENALSQHCEVLNPNINLHTLPSSSSRALCCLFMSSNVGNSLEFLPRVVICLLAAALLILLPVTWRFHFLFAIFMV